MVNASPLANYLASNKKHLAFRIAVNEFIVQILSGTRSYFCYHKAPKGETLESLSTNFGHPTAIDVANAIDNCIEQMLNDPANDLPEPKQNDL